MGYPTLRVNEWYILIGQEKSFVKKKIEHIHSDRKLTKNDDFLYQEA